MPKIVKTIITTDDTGKTYEMDGKNGIRPQLWYIEIAVDCLDNWGNHEKPGSKKAGFYVERGTLEKLGMVPYAQVKPPEFPNTQEDEVRETLEKLLSLVGIYPEQ
jgi:hypothetical protein